jgi:DNA-binding beta-propeller fold protein YncE
MRNAFAALVAFALAAAAAPAVTTLDSGHVVVSELPTIHGAPARLLRFDLQTRRTEVISDGPLVMWPRGLALDSQGNVLVISAGALYRVDPETGSQTLVAQGGFLHDPDEIAVDEDDVAYVLNRYSDVIARIDTWTGAQTRATRWALLTHPRGIAIAGDGKLFISDDRNDSAPPTSLALGAVLQVDPATEEQTHAAQEGGLLREPRGIVIEGGGSLLVVDAGESIFGTASIVRVLPESMTQTRVLASWLMQDPAGIAVAADGRLLLVDTTVNDVFRVDLASGFHERLGGWFASRSLGPSLAVVPAARLELVSDVLELGDVGVGRPAQASLELHNAGGGFLDVTTAMVPANAGFSVSFGPHSIRAGSGGEIPVIFTPAALGPAQAMVRISGDDADPPRFVTVRGTGIRTIAVDLRPNGNPALVRRFGSETMALLGAADLDVTQIDLASLAFGPGGAPRIGPPRGIRTDIDGDGHVDLVVVFDLGRAALEEDEACVRGALVDGSRFIGCEATGPR